MGSYRICSDDTALNIRCDELKEHSHKRGYKHSQIQREIKKARDQAVQLSRLKQKLHQGIPFVVTYNPASQSLNKIITKHLSILQSSNR